MTADSKTNDVVISVRDIMFECPSCHKSLVVDEAAEGMIVDCPQCRINVIVPPKPTLAVPAPAAPAAKPVEEKMPAAESDDLRSRLSVVSQKLKEQATQRAEVNNRLAARLNEVNRDLVLLARLETAQQQVIAELSQMINQLGATAGNQAGATRTRVNLRS